MINRKLMRKKKKRIFVEKHGRKSRDTETYVTWEVGDVPRKPDTSDQRQVLLKSHQILSLCVLHLLQSTHSVFDRCQK